MLEDYKMTLVITDSDGTEITHFYKKVGTNQYMFFCLLQNKWYHGNKEHRCPYCCAIIPRKLVKPYYLIPRALEDLCISENVEMNMKKDAEEQDQTGKDDMFKPPRQSRLVRCLHCEDTYQSKEMVFEKRGGWLKLWHCKNKDCSGAGYGFDIHDVRSEHGIKIIRPEIDKT